MLPGWLPAPIFDNLPDGVLVTDVAQSTLYVNRAVEAMTGYAAAELLGQNPRCLQGPDTDSATRAAIRRALAAEQPYFGEILNYRKDGSPFWNQLSISPLRGADGRLQGFFSLQRDVTPLRRALAHWKADQERLRLMAQLYQALADTRDLLRSRENDAAESVFQSLCERLVDIFAAPLATIGLLPPGETWVRFVAAAGAARGYVDGLRATDQTLLPEGQGAVGTALRTLQAATLRIDQAAFAPWKARAEQFGLASILVAAARVEDDSSRILLAVFRGPEDPFRSGQETLFLQMAQDLAAWLDRRATLRRLTRLQQFRDAHREIQARLLTAESAPDIFAVLAETLVRYTDAVAVNILVPDPARLMFRRAFVAGPLADWVASLPDPPLTRPPHGAHIPLPTRVWLARGPQLVHFPARDPLMPERWREGPLANMGVVAGWPIPRLDNQPPVGVATMVARDPDTFTPELSQLIAEIMQSTGIALTQVEDRRQIARLQRYQQAALQAQHEFLQVEQPEELYRRLVRLLVRETDCAAAYVVVPEPNSDWLRLAAVAARQPEVEQGLAAITPSRDPGRVPWGQLLCSRAFRAGQPLGPIAVREDRGLQAWLAEQAWADNLQAVMAWPIVLPDQAEPEAVLTVVSGQGDDLTPALLNLFALLAESLRAALQQLRVRATMAEWATRDPLTGLANRRAWDQALETALRQAADLNSPPRLAVCLVDLDDFKAVNDRFGHSAGDQVLKAVADRLQRAVDPDDVVARLGGDEFVLLLRRLSAPAAIAPALERLLQALAPPVTVTPDDMVTVHVSVGVALFPDDGERPQDLLRHADQALYQVKAGKPLRIAVSDWGRYVAPSAVDNTGDLDIVPGRTQVVYQPMWDLRRRRLVGVEALVRFPDSLTSAAPTSVLRQLSPRGRQQLTAIVLESALNDLLTATEHDWVLALNVWSDQLLSPSWREQLMQCLRQKQVPADRLMLELNDPPGPLILGPLRSAIENLRSIGIRIALEDFGPAWASPRHWLPVPADAIKFDAPTVRRLPERPEDLAWMDTLAQWARLTGLAVIATGAETPEIAQALARLDLFVVQGYAIARPMPWDALRQWQQSLPPDWEPVSEGDGPWLLPLYASAYRTERALRDLARHDPDLVNWARWNHADRCPVAEALQAHSPHDDSLLILHRRYHQALAQLADNTDPQALPRLDKAQEAFFRALADMVTRSRYHHP